MIKLSNFSLINVSGKHFHASSVRVTIKDDVRKTWPMSCNCQEFLLQLGQSSLFCLSPSINTKVSNKVHV